MFLMVGLNLTHAAEKIACYKIEGMTCATCSITIKTAAKKVDGVTKATVDTKNETAKVTFEDSKTSSVKISQAITNSGYKATEQTCVN
jgi:mercuric ion binding protein